jgi:hypothetical protein
MKAKKALKRLKKVETILSDVIDQCPASARGLRGLLDSAKTSVVRAKGVVHARVAAKKPPARAQEAARGGLSAEGRKRISLAAKKRWAAAKRKAINAVTGRPLSRTA